jgi:transcriptional regulator with XRE-family HTH domain
MKHRRSSMTVDGAKLRSLRLRKGMSQEKLGLLTNLNKRTIQRAENGQPVAIESLAFMAEALEVSPEALRSRQLELFTPSGPPKPTTQGEVVLVPVTRGSRLVNSLRAAFLASFEYEAEPTDENLKPLEEVASVLNQAWADPWQPLHLSEMSDTNLLRLQATANRVIPVLADLGIRIFVGLYPSWQQRPRYNGDEGFMYIRETFAKERLFNVCVVISDEPVGYITRVPPDHEDLDGTIPF